MQARCSHIACSCRVSGDLNTAARPSTCAFILTVCARSWSLTQPIRATCLPSRALGIALLPERLEEGADLVDQCLGLFEGCEVTTSLHDAPALDIVGAFGDA